VYPDFRSRVLGILGHWRYAAMACLCAFCAVVLVSYWRLNNPDVRELSGAWRITKVVDIIYNIQGHVWEGQTFDIDRRGLLFDRSGSGLSFQFVDIKCGPACFGLFDNYNGVAEKHFYKLEKYAAPDTWIVRTDEKGYFLIERR
jgi:hypothetical protein